MGNYINRLHDAILGDKDTRSILSLPIRGFKEKEKIEFRKTRGNVRLQGELIQTEEEATAYIEKVLKQQLP